MESDIASMERWLFDSATPLWRDVGFTPHGLAVEELDFGARAKDRGFHRVMVQFRQAFSFAKIAMAGKCDPSIARGLFLRAAAAAGHADGGWVHKLNSDGGVQDATRDLCDQAFGLLAAAWVYKASGDVEILKAAQHAVQFVKVQAKEGFAESIPPRLPRRQNTHMHLFEAFLAFYEVTGDATYTGLAGELLSLLKTKLVSAGGFLLEHFDAQFSPLEETKNWAEPGHHFEWVWLLHEYARLSRGTVDPVARRLFDASVRHGVDAEGFAIARIASGGAPLDGTRMLWAQTEMLKAYLVRGEDVRPILVNIGHFLPSSPAGIWYEKLDEQGSPIRHRMPASTFYHLTGAITELLRSQKAVA